MYACIYISIHGCRNQGAQGAHPPFFKVSGKVLLSCNLVVLLGSSKDAKITGKIHASSDFRGSKFQNFPGEHAPDP